jgi:hypothetical protein
MGKVTRRLVISIGAIVVAAAAVLGIGIWLGNRPVPPTEPRQLRIALGRALDWLQHNRASVPPDANPVLLWMLATADELLGGDPRLQTLVSEYKTQHMLPGLPAYRWYRLFDRRAVVTVADSGTAMLPPYHLHQFYGLTCDPLLSELDVVRAQNEADYCPSVWVGAPHCRSHQLMGLLWGLQQRCNGVTRSTAIQVRDALWREEMLEFRVDDAYIQRAVLLVSAPSRLFPLSPIWVNRIIKRQLSNGGWDEYDPLIPLTSGRYLMVGQRGAIARQPVASFHATAQAILLLAFLLHDQSLPSTSPLARWDSLQGN